MYNEQAGSSAEVELITSHLYTNLRNTQHRQAKSSFSA